MYVGGDPPQGGQNSGTDRPSSWAKEGSSPWLIGWGRGWVVQVLAWVLSAPAPHYTAGWGGGHTCWPSSVVPAGACCTEQVSSTSSPRGGRRPPLPRGPVSPTPRLSGDAAHAPVHLVASEDGPGEERCKGKRFLFFPIQSHSKRRARPVLSSGAQRSRSASQRRRFGPYAAHFSQHGLQVSVRALQPEVPVDSSKVGGAAPSCHRATCQRRAPGPVGTTEAASLQRKRE